MILDEFGVAYSPSPSITSALLAIEEEIYKAYAKEMLDMPSVLDMFGPRIYAADGTTYPSTVPVKVSSKPFRVPFYHQEAQQ